MAPQQFQEMTVRFRSVLLGPNVLKSNVSAFLVIIPASLYPYYSRRWASLNNS